MKINQYQEVYELLNSDMPDMEKACAFYSVVKKVDFDHVKDRVPIKKVLKFYRKFNGIKPAIIYGWYWIGWKLYRFDLNFSEYTAADVIALRSYFASEKELVNNLHKVVALVTIRKDKSLEHFENLSEKILKRMNVNKAYALSVFFCENYSEERQLIMLTKRLQKVNKKLTNIQQSKSGSVTSRLSTLWQKAIGRIGTTI